MSNDEYTTGTLGTSLGSFSDKKIQGSLPERQTEQKTPCLRLPRHTGNPQLKYGKASATTAGKTKSTRTPSLVSPYEKDWRFAVRAKSFALHWRSRGFFRGHVTHVRSCEKGLIDWRPAVCRSKGFHQARRRLSHITTTTAQTTNAYSHHHRNTTTRTHQLHHHALWSRYALRKQKKGGQTKQDQHNGFMLVSSAFCVCRQR